MRNQMSDLIKVRKIVTHTENIFHEGGPSLTNPIKKGSISIVLNNPYAGKFVEDITPMMEALKPVGLEAAEHLIKLLGGSNQIQSYGKGSIVGEEGELEHGALWHVPGGYAMREALGGALAIVPSSKKVGGIGCRLDIPITHINASYVRSHFDGMEVGMADAPRANEILVAVSVTDSGRPFPRVGGLTTDEAIGEDGLR